MTPGRLKWGLAAAGLVLAAVAFPGAVPTVLVGGLVLGWLLWRSSPSRSSSKGQRQLVVTKGALLAVAVAVLAFLAQGDGSDLGIFLCFAILAVAVLDLVVAAVVTAKVTTTMAVDRTEILVGDASRARLSVTGPHLPVSVKMGAAPQQGVEPDATGAMSLHPRARAVIVAFEVEVRSTGFCGLLGLVRRRSLSLPTPLSVGPRPVAPDQPFELHGRWGEGGHLPAPTGDVVRGVRDYVPGDRQSQVHWRASARTGRLVVKEVEEPFTPQLVLTLDVGRRNAAGELAAGRAAWYLNEALRRGAQVVLATWETTGPRIARVDSGAEIIRRLARANVGPPPEPGAVPGWRVLRVGPGGDSWD